MWAWEQSKYTSFHKNGYFGVTIKDKGLFQEMAPPDPASLIYVQFPLSSKENKAIFYTISFVGYIFLINILLSRWVNPCHKENSELSAYFFSQNRRNRKQCWYFLENTYIWHYAKQGNFSKFRDSLCFFRIWKALVWLVQYEIKFCFTRAEVFCFMWAKIKVTFPHCS